ncbi:hypothetical protein SK128_019537 [Halocaridina rubra]|uniref:ZP domain-containing protein n=1 Tax=Halocaridina rubra TaxID=373956 RepID=A0AAN8WY62_HALRR
MSCFVMTLSMHGPTQCTITSKISSNKLICLSPSSAGFRPVGENDIISNTAPTPTVRMRIYKANDQEANNVDLGELLTLKIEMEQASAFAIFARNLEARTDNGELMTLIDNIGCPRYPNIFPELQVEDRTKHLFGNFKAFRFPSTARVNFVATVRFCQEECPPVSVNEERVA